ncbi:unnamed protein product, partial [marine sediment metagenome]
PIASLLQLRGKPRFEGSRRQAAKTLILSQRVASVFLNLDGGYCAKAGLLKTEIQSSCSREKRDVRWTIH